MSLQIIVENLVSKINEWRFKFSKLSGFRVDSIWDEIKNLPPQEFSAELNKYPKNQDHSYHSIKVVQDPDFFFVLPEEDRTDEDFSRMWFWYGLENNWVPVELKISSKDQPRPRHICILINKKTDLCHLADHEFEPIGCETVQGCLELVRDKYNYMEDIICSLN